MSAWGVGEADKYDLVGDEEPVEIQKRFLGSGGGGTGGGPACGDASFVDGDGRGLEGTPVDASIKKTFCRCI